LAAVLEGIKNCYLFAGRIHKAREFSDRSLVLAERTNEPELIAVAHFSAAHISFYLGEFTSSRSSMRRRRACLPNLGPNRGRGVGI
jgi:hypothetical protein